MYKHIRTYMYLCICVCMCVQYCVYIYICIYLFIHIHIIYIYICIHIQVGSLEVGSFQAPLIRLRYALRCLWERYGSLMGDCPPTDKPPVKGFNVKAVVIT